MSKPTRELRRETCLHYPGHELPLDDGLWVAAEVCRWSEACMAERRTDAASSPAASH